MSFPVSPLDGQSAIVNNILYIYNQAYNTWTRVPGTTVLGGVSNTDGVLMWNTANAAFGVANTANSLARGAFTLGNTTATTVSTHTSYINSIYPKTNAAFVQANTAYDQANLAFAAANAAGSSATVTAAFDTANAAFVQANTSYDYAVSAYGQANTATTNASTADTKAVNAASYANGAFTQANTATNSATAAFSQANVAFGTANSKVFIFYQNTAPTTANTRDEWVDSDTGIKYQNLNGTTPLWVELGPTTAVSESPTATAAFDLANSVNILATSAFNKANNSGTYANGAFALANTAITTTGGSITGRLNVAFTPATTANTAVLITAANTKGGAGYADVLQITNTSGGATNPSKYIRLGPTGTLEIINSGYTGMPLVLTDSGDLTVSGNVLASGAKSGYSSGRPGFRVFGSTTSSHGTGVNTGGYLNSNQWTVDFNQGSYLNGTTGVFTAPVAGLYQVNVVARNAGNTGSISQIVVIKNATGGNGNGGTIVLMVEFAASSTMNHTGGATCLQLAAGDTLVLKVAAGTIQFDSNDNWSLAYIG